MVRGRGRIDEWRDAQHADGTLHVRQVIKMLDYFLLTLEVPCVVLRSAGALLFWAQYL